MGKPTKDFLYYCLYFVLSFYLGHFFFFCTPKEKKYSRIFFLLLKIIFDMWKNSSIFEFKQISRWLQLSFSILVFVANLVFFWYSSRVSNIESDNSQNVGLENYNNISDRIFPHFTTPSHSDSKWELCNGNYRRPEMTKFQFFQIFWT